jgi:hypothetical protein
MILIFTNNVLKTSNPTTSGSVSQTLRRNASTHGISKYETRGSEFNKCQTANTPAQPFRNGLLKVDVPVVQELHTVTTLLGPILLCQSNNALRHT